MNAVAILALAAVGGGLVGWWRYYTPDPLEKALAVVTLALTAALVVGAGLAAERLAGAQTTGCEHSSNFHAPPGCPDDGSGPRNPDGTPAPYPWSAPSSTPAIAVVATPAVTG